MVKHNAEIMLFTAMMTLMLGCGPSAITPVNTTSPVRGLLVQVRELDASKADVRNYSEPVQPYGLQTAQAIVEALQEAGVNAEHATADGGDTGQRLQEVQRLFEKGLITKEEYDQKRAAILKGL